MMLDLRQLRQDYKFIYKSNWPLATKINILIEVAKIELKFQAHSAQAPKRITLSKILQQAGVSVRTLQRWKQSGVPQKKWTLF